MKAILEKENCCIIKISKVNNFMKILKKVRKTSEFRKENTVDNHCHPRFKNLTTALVKSLEGLTVNKTNIVKKGQCELSAETALYYEKSHFYPFFHFSGVFPSSSTIARAVYCENR